MDSPSLDEQKSWWNQWDRSYLQQVGDEGIRRGEVATAILQSLKLEQPLILEVGCGNGWLCERLVSLGKVTGIDIADQAILEAHRRVPTASFLAGDFASLQLTSSQFDVALTLETFSHVPDQAEFIKSLAAVLKPKGYLIITSQNKAVYSQRANVAPRAHGQLRNWVTMAELKDFLARDFDVRQAFTIQPTGNLGFQRYLNSAKLNKVASLLVPRSKLESWKERAGYGQTLVVLAQRK
jgi:2-polyprenyl-3-methyl-5-hydroxy-6-metoxy-1,4-benzoquinol methylase